MPASWVRVRMVTRLDKTLRDHSAVSLPILTTTIKPFKHKLTPVVPCRGLSLSLEGGQVPLSYFPGVTGGIPGMLVQRRDGRIPGAPQAMEETELPSVTLVPKQSL